VTPPTVIDDGVCPNKVKMFNTNKNVIFFILQFNNFELYEVFGNKKACGFVFCNLAKISFFRT
jgi:hypothetical protein